MNREIKFRAWIKERKEMTYDETDDLDSQYVDSLGAINYSLKSNRYEFMQYTGLKDNNKEDIYEGDIIEFWSYNEKHDEVDTGIALITWDEFRYGYDADLSDCKQRKNRKNLNSKILVIPLDMKDLTGRSEISRRDLGNLGSVKIRGNIYENPELLKPQP